MTDAKSSIVVLDQVSATSPARTQTLSSEGVLDALKMILSDVPLNDVLHSVSSSKLTRKEMSATHHIPVITVLTTIRRLLLLRNVTDLFSKRYGKEKN
jgi:hypothetical protein